MLSLPPHLINILWITIVAGIAGGIVSWVIGISSNPDIEELGTNDEAKPSFVWWHNVLIGLAASFCVPLFLSTIQSNLIKNAEQDAINFFIYAGICLVSAISARRFLNALTAKTLSDLNKDINQAKKIANAAKTVSEAGNETAETALNVAAFGAEPNEKSEESLSEKTAESEILNEPYFEKAFKNSLRKDIESVRQVLKELSSTSKYKYRTVQGIAKAINSDPFIVEVILEELEENKLVKKIIVPGPPERILWFHNDSGLNASNK